MSLKPFFPLPLHPRKRGYSFELVANADPRIAFISFHHPANAANVNFVNSEEYPSTTTFSKRCVNMIASLFHSPASPGVGTDTVGSSEAIMLAGLAMKWRWRDARKAAGLASDRPNLVVPADTQVCWEKLCRYFDVEERIVNLAPDGVRPTAAVLAAACDDNTIGVVAILGSTYTGEVVPSLFPSCSRFVRNEGHASWRRVLGLFLPFLRSILQLLLPS